jgi:hypothetical protein
VSEPTRESMPPFSAEIAGAVLRASRRSAAVVHEDMREGLTGLATIAYLAPWFGLLATVLAIPDSFVGCGGEKSACMAAMVIRLSRSIWPTAFGLLIGLISAWGKRYLTGNLEALDHAMEGAALDLVNQLSRYRGRWTFGPNTQPVLGRPIFGARPLAESKLEQGVWCRSVLRTAATLIAAWFLQAVRYFEHDHFTLASAPWAACKYVLLVFGVSCIPAYVVSVRILRRSGSTAVLAAASCLVWCLAELILGVDLL